MHERGAPHLIDPSKLLESAARLYGDDMGSSGARWRRCPRSACTRCAGGETVEGFRVAYTPGHASHHVCYLHEETGDAYVGDVAGVRIPPHELHGGAHAAARHRRGAWLDSLHTVAALEPAVALPDPLRPGDRRGRAAAPRCARRCRARPSSARDRRRGAASSRGCESGWPRAPTRRTMESFEQAAPPDQLYQGLARYWRKQRPE